MVPARARLPTSPGAPVARSPAPPPALESIELDIHAMSWPIALILFVIPPLLVAGLKAAYRKRGGPDPGWGAALFVTLCWVIGLLVILSRVID